VLRYRLADHARPKRMRDAGRRRETYEHRENCTMLGTIRRSAILPAVLAAPVFLALGALPASAEVRTQAIEYRDGDTVLTGLLAWDDAATDPRPGVLVVHEWWGLNDYAKGRAEELAAEGYVAFALDMYGDGKVTDHPDQAGAWMQEITGNLETWTRRAQLGLDVLRAQDQVADTSLAAIGYCFGGATVMQMAYAGAEVKAVASFHGSLPPPPESVAAIAPRVFVAHGRADSFIPPERVLAFQDGLDRVNATWDMTIYSGARHGFTNPGAGAYGIENIQYDERADRESWAAMLTMFENVFAGN
jgi:dienelactone hydrolase